MRIVGGHLGGRRIPVPKAGARPTSERVREALMSQLGAGICGARVLDAFAGSGAFGFEALSRGAQSVVFVERRGETCRLLAETAQTLALSAQTSIRRGDAAQIMAALPPSFDLIFLDPPYADRGALEAALRAAGRLLTPTGLCVCEHARDYSPPTDLPAPDAEHARFDPALLYPALLYKVRRRDYGATSITLYQPAASTGEPTPEHPKP